jgi:hypothetical protein
MRAVPRTPPDTPQHKHLREADAGPQGGAQTTGLFLHILLVQLVLFQSPDESNWRARQSLWMSQLPDQESRLQCVYLSHRQEMPPRTSSFYCTLALRLAVHYSQIAQRATCKW